MVFVMAEEKHIWTSERYLKMYGDPRDKKGTQAELCKDAARHLTGESVLDVGCGLGHLIPFIGDRAYVGVDYSPEMLEIAKSCFPGRMFVEADAFQLDLERMFDSVISISLFLHLIREDAKKVLERMWAHTAKGGRVIFSMETFGDNMIRRPPRNRIQRNQSMPKVLEDIREVCGGASVAAIPQSMRYRMLLDVRYMKASPLTVRGAEPIAMTTLFKVVKSNG